MCGVAAGLARKLNERRRVVKPSLDVMVGCSAVGEPGCGGLRLGLKNEGVLEGRFEGAFNHGKKIRIVVRVDVDEWHLLRLWKNCGRGLLRGI